MKALNFTSVWSKATCLENDTQKFASWNKVRAHWLAVKHNIWMKPSRYLKKQATLLKFTLSCRMWGIIIMVWGIYNLSKSGIQQWILCFCSCVYSMRKLFPVNILALFVFLGNGKIILENLCLQNVTILSQDMTTCLSSLYAVKICWLFEMVVSCFVSFWCVLFHCANLLH
jgi:hypothetical protein